MTIAMPSGLRALSPIEPLAPGTVLGCIGRFSARLASGEREIEAAQRLRARAFFGCAESTDTDRFDLFCDHLLVLEGERIVGTYRLIREEAAKAAGGFYSAGEFHVEPLIARNSDLRFLELGRSCVDPDFRGRGALESMWQAIWAYVRHYRIDAMMGCASFPGTVPAAHAEALSLLAHRFRAHGRWGVEALPALRNEMDLMPAEAVLDNEKAIVARLPPLLRGYLRLGAQVGEGCVVDEDVGTTDVFVVLPVGAIGQRYIDYYGPDRRAA